MLSFKTKRIKCQVCKDLLSKENQLCRVKAEDWLVCVESLQVELGIALVFVTSSANQLTS